MRGAVQELFSSAQMHGTCLLTQVSLIDDVRRIMKVQTNRGRWMSRRKWANRERRAHLDIWTNRGRSDD